MTTDHLPVATQRLVEEFARLEGRQIAFAPNWEAREAREAEEAIARIRARKEIAK